MNYNLQFAFDVCQFGIKPVNYCTERYNFHELMNLPQRKLVDVIRNSDERSVKEEIKEKKAYEILVLCYKYFDNYDDARTERKREAIKRNFFQEISAVYNKSDLAIYSSVK